MIKPRTQTGQSSGGIAVAVAVVVVVVDGRCPATATTTATFTTTTFCGYRGITGFCDKLTGSVSCAKHSQSGKGHMSLRSEVEKSKRRGRLRPPVPARAEEGS